MNRKRALTRPLVVLVVALACSLLAALSATSAFAAKGGNRQPPPPQPPAGWEVIIRPYGSAAYGISGGQQVGQVGGHAALWRGTADEWVDLHPLDGASTRSCAYGISGGQQVGVISGGAGGASLWSGSASSRVDLYPEGPQESYFAGSAACDISDGQVVGYVSYVYPGWDKWEYTSYAMLWTESGEVYLGGSYALGVGDGQQVGYVMTSAPDYGVFDPLRPHAKLWSGSLESGVDLHPKKAFESRALDVSGGQQVGYATFGDNREWPHYSHAGIWFGTAASWVDLHPAGFGRSEAHGVSCGYQAGSAWTGGWLPGADVEFWVGNQHAGMWSGTAKSWVDLHALLPPDYADSGAEDIEVTDTDIWVVGWASLPTSGGAYSHAVLWHKALSE